MRRSDDDYDSPSTDAVVRQSVTVKTNVERAFRVFTAEFDRWWPRSHHIGKSPMTKAIIEPVRRRPLLQRAGGRHRSALGDR
jgi:hypothetical protein